MKIFPSTPDVFSRFDPTFLAHLDPTRIPQAIAFIPDGNRRWAKKCSSTAQTGHQEGADILMDIVKASLELGVKEVSFYVFSTENWARPQEEVDALMSLYAYYLATQCEEMVASGIKLETIGDLTPLPPFLLEVIAKTKDATKGCDKISLILALNYGARNELCRAFKKMAHDLQRGKLNEEQISERLISDYLDTRSFHDPELLIRTSGEMRLSNYLLWQISYTEMYLSPVLWPDFKPHHLLEAIIDYQGRERRWGGAS